MMNKKSFPINKILITGIAAAVFILAAFLAVIILITYKPSIAFYNVSDTVCNQVIKIANDNSKRKYEPIILDKNKPLSAQKKQFKHAKLLIAANDFDVTEFSKNSSIVKNISASFLNGMPSTISASVPKNKNNIKYVPVLYDFYQIDVNYPLFLQTDVKNIDFWSDFVKLAEAEVISDLVKYPVVFGGNENPDFLNIFGMLIEALYSCDEYENFLNDVYAAWKIDFANNDNSFSEITKILSSNGKYEAVLESIADQFISLINKKAIMKETFTNEAAAAVFYPDNQLCGVFFTTLSQHRMIDSNVSNEFTSIYCPSYKENDKRKFVAPEICALPLSSGKKTKQLILDLSCQKQTEFSTTTGLAPVQKNCQVADIQADDVRYWIAASSGPVKPLSAALPSKEARDFVNNYLLSMILQ